MYEVEVRRWEKVREEVREEVGEEVGVRGERGM